jgi:hypothetical protein
MGNQEISETVTLLARRRIEAAMLAEVHAVLVDRLGEEQALRCLEETVTRAAFAAGQAFAATAPHRPNLTHFRSVVALWQRGDALTIGNIRSEETRFLLRCHRCR